MRADVTLASHSRRLSCIHQFGLVEHDCLEHQALKCGSLYSERRIVFTATLIIRQAWGVLMHEHQAEDSRADLAICKGMTLRVTMPVRTRTH